jgi:hypothetical protein
MNGKTKTTTPSTESKFDKNSASGDYIYSNGGKDEYHPNDYKNNLVEEPCINVSMNHQQEVNREEKEYS